MTRNPKVDKSLRNSMRWWQEKDVLREVLLECGLTEELKWRSPSEMTRSSEGETPAGLAT